MLSFPLSARDYKRIAKFRCSILREFCARILRKPGCTSWITRERLLQHVSTARASSSVFNGTLTTAVLLNYWYLLGITGICTNMFSCERVPHRKRYPRSRERLNLICPATRDISSNTFDSLLNYTEQVGMHHINHIFQIFLSLFLRI